MTAQPDYESHSGVYSLIILAPEPESAHHSSSTSGAGDLLHHFSSLFELLDETVDFLDRSAAPGCDSRATLAIQNGRIVALLACKETAYCLNSFELPLFFSHTCLPPHFLHPPHHPTLSSTASHS